MILLTSTDAYREIFAQQYTEFRNAGLSHDEALRRAHFIIDEAFGIDNPDAEYDIPTLERGE